VASPILADGPNYQGRVVAWNGRLWPVMQDYVVGLETPFAGGKDGDRRLIIGEPESYADLDITYLARHGCVIEGDESFDEAVAAFPTVAAPPECTKDRAAWIEELRALGGFLDPATPLGAVQLLQYVTARVLEVAAHEPEPRTFAEWLVALAEPVLGDCEVQA
jgi:hypothetical protein